MPSLNWIGKEAVTQHHKQVPFRMLQPVAELSCGEATLHRFIAVKKTLFSCHRQSKISW
jgi:hypothetical protein